MVSVQSGCAASGQDSSRPLPEDMDLKSSGRSPAASPHPARPPRELPQAPERVAQESYWRQGFPMYRPGGRRASPQPRKALQHPRPIDGILVVLGDAARSSTTPGDFSIAHPFLQWTPAQPAWQRLDRLLQAAVAAAQSCLPGFILVEWLWMVVLDAKENT